jgi:3-oxoacyl-[acyl-carrier protein] reductase
VNLTGHTTMIRACLADLTRDGARPHREHRLHRGARRHAVPERAYTASKHGVIGLTRRWPSSSAGGGDRELRLPRPDPHRHDRRHPRRAQGASPATVPIGRYGSPEEVAHATLSLVLPAASFVNAAVLVVDGGLTAQNT